MKKSLYVEKWWNSVKNKRWFIRLTNWEYWPTLAFYWPMFVAGPLLALRSRHPVFFSTANPGIKAAGVGLESKFETISKIPQQWRPRTALLPPQPDTGELRRQLLQAGIAYPLIAKPDMGFRGLLVSRIESEQELLAYLSRNKVPFILQEFLAYPEEIGVLYYRMPGEQKGRISSLTFKQFLRVTGDGHATVRQLIERQPRALLQWERLAADFNGLLDKRPGKGRQIPLGIIGNHAKGTMFINANDRIDDRLEATFDKIADEIDGFNYGRFDVKCQSFEKLRLGEDFKIVELNGVFSEPTHIYDQMRMSYFGALVTILRHWRLIRRIAARNHAKGAAYMSTATILRELAGMWKYVRNLES